MGSQDFMVGFVHGLPLRGEPNAQMASSAPIFLGHDISRALPSLIRV